MINFRIKIKISIFLNFFIEPPPPITGRDEPNNTLMTFLMYLLYHEIRQNIDVFLKLTFTNYHKYIHCKITFPLRNAVRCSSLCGVPLLPKSHKHRRVRHAPNKHYAIPFVKSMPHSSLYHIQLRTPQAT